MTCSIVYIFVALLIVFCLCNFCSQALYASTSISTGMKGATKAMSAMNKVGVWNDTVDSLAYFLQIYSYFCVTCQLMIVIAVLGEII